MEKPSSDSIPFTMSLTANFQHIYTRYQESSLEELRSKLEWANEDIHTIERHSARFHCECKAFVVPIDTSEDNNGSYKVTLSQYPMNQLCDSCSTSLHSLIGAGKPDAGHLHPRLYAFINYHYIDLLEKCIYAKENQFYDLTNEELQQKAESSYTYSRYLRRSENNFHWSNEESPSGLRTASYDNEKEMDALDFEKRARFLRGVLPSS